MNTNPCRCRCEAQTVVLPNTEPRSPTIERRLTYDGFGSGFGMGSLSFVGLATEPKERRRSTVDVDVDDGEDDDGRHATAVQTSPRATKRKRDDEEMDTEKTVGEGAENASFSTTSTFTGHRVVVTRGVGKSTVREIRYESTRGDGGSAKCASCEAGYQQHDNTTSNASHTTNVLQVATRIDLY
ncbi:hypothetical protein V9T40_006453 [Parthenolecanium corni]|uniref:Uncharacterized protein n=1 Tax=Parthenolecanium corni TaxID=536013 RepID=A0AAN9Y7F0_9HEMI